MVFIYGGGFITGFIDDELLNPKGLVLNSVNAGTLVIYVAMNYRLGIFGFADHPLLREQMSLNVGLRDQRLALEWVRENIEIFGGDPDQVTLFGQSAGAVSTILQMTAFGGEINPPFNRAISESFAVEFGITTAISPSMQNSADVVTASGCSYLESELSLECLRSLPLEDLLAVSLTVANEVVPQLNGEAAYVPVVDGNFIPDAPSILLKSGRFSDVPLVIGWNNDDATLLLPTNTPSESDVVNGIHSLLRHLTNSTLDHILELYPLSDFIADPAKNVTAEFARLSRIGRDTQFTCPSLFIAAHIASFHAKTLSEATYQTETESQRTTFQRIIGSLLPNQDHRPVSEGPFLYHLNQTVLEGFFTSGGIPQAGIAHNSDLPYVFDNLQPRVDPLPSDFALAKQVSSSWSRFATLGFPSSPKGPTLQGWVPAWKSHNKDLLRDARVMVIGGENLGTSGLVGRDDILADQKLPERCGFILSENVLQEIGF